MFNIHIFKNIGQTKVTEKSIEVLKMDINIRKTILQNIKENSHDELEATIADAIEDGEEKMLPGLGFLFELIWKQADEEERVELVDTLQKDRKSTRLNSSHVSI